MNICSYAKINLMGHLYLYDFYENKRAVNIKMRSIKYDKLVITYQKELFLFDYFQILEIIKT